ncbi:MAG TPA: efflux RND transporter permease subunit [Crocinitomicaceae bacterium]|nr:efflux RND transporter permease subunit [Crocinitomicaceae bacterium]
MRKIIQFFINRPVWGNAAIVLVLMFGLFSLFTMKRSFFPELEPNRIFVSVFYPGASPSEMEEGVTIKIEQAVKGLDGIEEINSTSSENFSQVTIKAYVDTDIDELLSNIENSVNSINSFPAGAERPMVNKQQSRGMASVVAFVGISAVNSNTPITELTDLATKVERDLLNTKEITQIIKNGFPEKEISINVREQDLLRYNISMQELALTVGSNNIDITTGVIRGGVEEMNIRSNNRGTSEEAIGNILLRTTPSGAKIVVSDVADVSLGYSESSQEAKYNGKPAVSFQIEKTIDQDITNITEELYKYKEEFNKKNPDFKFNIFYEFNEMLNQRIELLSRNGMMGLILVLLFLGLFLNLKLSAWVAFGIPFSFLGMFILGTMYGMSINMISLFGMILVVGILVDDGIVIAENIFTHFEKGKPAHQAALDGTMEVLPSVFSSVITTIVAFSILLFVEGMEMMREMAFVVIGCLAFSLFEAFIILPSHLGHKRVLAEQKNASFSYLKGGAFMLIGLIVIFIGTRLYPLEPSLGLILFPLGLIVFGAILFFTGFSKSSMESKVLGGADKGIKYIRDNWFNEAVKNIVGTGKTKWYRAGFVFPMVFTFGIVAMTMNGIIGTTFFPDIQPDFFTIEAVYKPGDSKEKSKAFVAEATRILFEENDRIIQESGDSLLTYFSSNIGFAMNIGQGGNHASMVQVFFDGENTTTPVDTLMNRIVARINATSNGKLAQNTYVGGFNRFGKEIEIGITSANDVSLMQARDMLKLELEKMDGVFNVKDNMPLGKNEVYLTMRPEADIYGIAKSDVLRQVRAGFFGQEAQRVIIGTDEVKVWVRYPLEDRNSLQDLETMKIKSPQGLAIPLQEICDFKVGRAPQNLRRKDGQRIIRLDAECTDPDKVGDINSDIKEDLFPKLNQTYSDVKLKRLGQAERSEKTSSSMKYVGIIGIAIMFIILTLHFNSLSSSFLIMLVIPAGIAGAILGHGLVGIPVSILSVFGMIALTGVLVNDAIVFLDRYNDLIKEGLDIKSAALDAASSRFRPIILTSLTTVAGLLPIISEKSMQAQFLIPMAVSIAFGVLFGTLFILFFYPSAILFWNGVKRNYRFILKGERNVDPRLVEPALKLEQNAHDFEK